MQSHSQMNFLGVVALKKKKKSVVSINLSITAPTGGFKTLTETSDQRQIIILFHCSLTSYIMPIISNQKFPD